MVHELKLVISENLLFHVHDIGVSLYSLVKSLILRKMSKGAG